MTKPSISQSQKRFKESVSALFSTSALSSEKNCLFIKSSSDIGVIRNGGRNGARFAPQSLLSTWKKLAQNKMISDFSFIEVEVADQDEEEINFHLAQKKEAERISTLLKSHRDSRIIHIGGGHDHIYPLLLSLGNLFQKIIVINVDAHADTRTDENFHSGTPFRQFANDYEGDFILYQIGLHPFANSFSTLSDLSKGKRQILWRNDFTSSKLATFFDNIKQEVDDKTLVLFSLDADAIAGAEVPGVSAVNPAGLTSRDVLDVWAHYQKLPLSHEPVLGIYELNPLYDTLSSLSMRTIASFIYEGF